jgi:gliding motility-associated-like protein
MIRLFPHILLSGIVLLGTFKVTGQMAMPDNVSVGQSRQYYVDPNPGSTYTWWINGVIQTGFATNEFTHTWNNEGTFLLEVQERTVYGCPGPVRSGQVNVNLVGSMHLIIHEAFSPNGDLINDSWNIGYSELYPKMEVIIYNRWGQLVWKSGKGYPDPWDGKSYGVELPADSYHYVIDLHNGSKIIVGVVTIVN